MTNDNQLALVVKESGLQPNKIDDLMKSFAGYFNQARTLAEASKDIVVTDEKQVGIMLKAREARLELKKIRVDVENTRVQLKEQSLREGKAIDGASNLIKALIVPVEEHLERQEKFIETLESERLEKKLADRIESLTPFVDDISFYNLKDLSDSAFDNLLNSSKAAYKAKKDEEAKIEKERLAKEEADHKEQERIRLENEKLKKEAEAREARIKAEQKLQEEKLAAERRKTEEAEAKLRAEKEAQLKKEQEAKIAEEARVKAEEETKRQELLAPDKEKLLKLANGMTMAKLPAVESREASHVIEEVKLKLDDIVNFIREEAAKL